jgi:hypothetical protein
VEIRSRATKKKVRCLVNDRGPYTWFTIDLSQAAARTIGVDVAEDRTIDVRIIALPGETPIMANVSGQASPIEVLLPAGAGRRWLLRFAQDTLRPDEGSPSPPLRGGGSTDERRDDTLTPAG